MPHELLCAGDGGGGAAGRMGDVGAPPMIRHALARFADHQVRADLDKALNARDQARDTARRLFARLKATRHALETQAAITERWKSIAQQAQQDLAAERADHAKTRAGRQLAIDMHDAASRAHGDTLAELAAERARTQETHR